MNTTPKLTLSDVQRKFEHWRKTRQHRSSIPKELWDAAIGLVGDYTTLEVSKALNLTHKNLKKQILENSPHTPPVSSADFVELGVMQATGTPQPCIIEVSDKNDATMKMTITGKPCFDIVKLAQAFWARKS